MSLFSFSQKKHNAAPQPTAGENTPQAAVRVLGSGCKTCHTLYENVCSAVQTLGADVTVEYVTDLRAIAETGVLQLPALLIGDRVAASGRALSAAQAAALLQQHGIGKP